MVMLFVACSPLLAFAAEEGEEYVLKAVKAMTLTAAGLATDPEVTGWMETNPEDARMH